MKTTLILLVVLFLAFLFYYRQRVYLRDPIATVYRNNVPQSGFEVYFNYSNEVLLFDDTTPTPRRILLQAWNKMPGAPMTLTCLHWIACMTEADNASSIPLVSTKKGPYKPNVFISGHQVLFTDTDGSPIRVELR